MDFAIVNGISNHRRGRLDLEMSRKVLGYAPEDDSWEPRANLENLDVLTAFPLAYTLRLAQGGGAGVAPPSPRPACDWQEVMGRTSP